MIEKEENLCWKMLSAIHSFCWYDGLLEAAYDDNDEIIFVNVDKDGNELDPDDKDLKQKSFTTIIKYEDDCIIKKLIRKLEYVKNEKDFPQLGYEEANEIFEGGDEDFSNRYSMLWQMLVEMFGSCGTSPRYGCIDENIDGAIEFLNILLHFEYLEDKRIREKSDSN